ncbi:hypothetical protein BRC83_00770 [Halobacteriales archaeon QS_1_68_17]|nr:MAG: hypothetical protein BRC83_00770 [Halobacteriales archaeon QS_1_68_17]
MTAHSTADGEGEGGGERGSEEVGLADRFPFLWVEGAATGVVALAAGVAYALFCGWGGGLAASAWRQQ